MHQTANTARNAPHWTSFTGDRFGRRGRSVASAVLLPFMAWISLLTAGLAQQDDTPDTRFDWKDYRTSPADLLINDADVFRHSKPGLDSDEVRAWQGLLDEVVRRREAVTAENAEGTARWEMAFYRFADLRRTAWENNTLEIRKPEERKDPFRSRDPDVPEEPAASLVETEYSVITDIQNHPEDFVGKPVVLRGILQRPIQETMGQSARRRGPEGTVLSVGELIPFDGPNISIARVHTTSVDRTSAENPGIGPWPENKKYLPVLVKGWVVKLWDDRRPLIYCESVRELNVQPLTSLIRRYAVSQQPLLNKESWLYYETISTLETVQRFKAEQGQRFWEVFPQKHPPQSPQQLADSFLRLRLDNLLAEIAAKYKSDKSSLESRRKIENLSEKEYDFELKRLDYLVNERIRRYHVARRDPRQFDTYVDLFMNPDEWQGHLVTLRGHVRHVVSYPAKHPEFRGRKLHELWLFTDDSQSNPAVIITPTLPEEFPVDADLIDQVSVTGCVFKQYVYRSQDSRRIAPLILADGIQWSPSDSHLVSLQQSGHLAAGSRLAQRAELGRSQGLSGSVLLLVGFAATLTIMVLWGRAQRDRRERRNLMNRIAERPEFETSIGGDYAPRLSEYTSRYDL